MASRCRRATPICKATSAAPHSPCRARCARWSRRGGAARPTPARSRAGAWTSCGRRAWRPNTWRSWTTRCVPLPGSTPAPRSSWRRRSARRDSSTTWCSGRAWPPIRPCARDGAPPVGRGDAGASCAHRAGGGAPRLVGDGDARARRRARPLAQGGLDAMRHHSLGFAQWDDVGKMLYLADYLEPGRPFDQELRRSLAARVPEERDAILKQVAARRIARVIDGRWPLLRETVDFWNALVGY